jgi:hypothetical protein
VLIKEIKFYQIFNKLLKEIHSFLHFSWTQRVSDRQGQAKLVPRLQTHEVLRRQHESKWFLTIRILTKLKEK